MRVPLRVFADFCCSTGRRRVAVVRDHKNGRGYDFYGDFTVALRGAHERAGNLQPKVAERELPELLAGAMNLDRRKARIFPRLVSGYARVLTDLGPNTWVPTKLRTLPASRDVEVAVQADLGLKLEKDVAVLGSRQFLLHYNAEPLAEHAAQLTTFMMRASFEFAEEQEPSACGMVDVLRGKVVTPTISPEMASDFHRLLRAEAAAFASLFDAVG